MFHARWWDYSDMPLNINGRTCAITSIGFGGIDHVLASGATTREVVNRTSNALKDWTVCRILWALP